MTDESSAAADNTTQPRGTNPKSTASTTKPMTTASRCERIVEFTDHSETRHRVRYVPQPTNQWQRIKERWSGKEWVHLSQEAVSDINQWRRPV